MFFRVVGVFRGYAPFNHEHTNHTKEHEKEAGISAGLFNCFMNKLYSLLALVSSSN